MASLCSPNAVAAYDYFRGKGLESFQAAAIVGNLQRESGSTVNTRAFDAKDSYGIAQWRLERWQNLLAYAAGSGSDPWSLGLQLEFLWHELETTPRFGLDALRRASSLEEATRIFQDRFERCDPARCALDERIANARAIQECSTLYVPKRSKLGAVAAAVGVTALVAIIGYGIWQKREPVPVRRPFPRYRPPDYDRGRLDPDRIRYL
jgi:hypothetical protein